MIAHLYLVINIFSNNINKPNQWIQLTNGLNIAKEDIEQGKIIVRSNENNTIQYTNIRKNIENLSIPQAYHYNIGLGAANNRTNTQIIMAKKYTQYILNHSANHIILVDASINTKDDERTAKQQKIEKTGYEGYGGIHLTKSNNKIQGYAQECELQGIATAVDMAQ